MNYFWSVVVDISFKNWPKIAQKYPLFNENRDSSPLFTNLVGEHPRNIHTEFEGNTCVGLEEVKMSNYKMYICM